MKILNVIDIPWNSALAAYAFDQALALRGAGHTVYFACPEGSAAMDFARREGFKIFAIPGRKDHLRLPQAVFRLRSFSGKEKIDVVCAHTGRAQTIACLLGRPVVRVKADAKIPSAGLIFSMVAKVITASSYIENLYRKAGLDQRRVTVIRQGLKARSVPAPAAASLKIGILGRLDPVKGHACFLKAAAELVRRGMEAEFHIAGYEANVKYSELGELAAELGITGRVVFHGKIEDGFKFMESCDIGVIASLGSEAVSRAALEWLAAGRPLVSTTVGSLPEYTGGEWTIPPGDHMALADKLAGLLSNRGKLKTLGEENRARVARDFSPEAFAAATVSLFEKTALKKAGR